ncbi:MAG: NAD(P)-dependent oxidoreductase [Rhizobacter sp.]|nr:NAD(P)-dependent oxidoreductase [Rhizobacter sp.]
MSNTTRIGIIGIGAMGLAMARNLHARAYPLLVRDIAPRAVAEAAALGIQACDTPAALAARCDVLVIVVVDAAQIEDVLFGPGGVVHAAPAAPSTREHPLAVMVCSTIAAHDTEGFAERLKAHAVDLMDAPISGGPVRAADGSMSMMLACEPALLARHDTLLRDLAAKLFFIGPKVGDAARTKLVNNLLAGVNLVAAAEAMALGARLGLDRQALFDVINASSGASWIGQDRMARALAGDYVPRARAAILTKDVTLAVQMADAAGIDTKLGDAALSVFKATVAAGLGEQDDAAVVKAIWPEF